MFTYYLKSALRNLWKNKSFSVINISGFAFGISICLAIALFLIKEYSYDRYHKNAPQIVRLINSEDNTSSIDYRVKDILLQNYPEIRKWLFGADCEPSHGCSGGRKGNLR